jgi:trehalose/maltose hydrolase-like predicted phosphorylase
MAKLDFTADLAAIREVSRAIYRPLPEHGSLVIPQFDGYRRLEDAPLEEVLRRKLHPNEYLGGGNGVAVTTQVIKQADVVLALALLGADQPPEVKSANWEYYEPRTEHGSSLSACAYSIVAAETGRSDAAYAYFMKAAKTDMGAAHKSFVGTLFIGGTHPAASGGAWMAAVFGLCGIAITMGSIEVSPRLPAHWSSVSVPLIVRGYALRITVDRQSIGIAAGPGCPLRFVVQGQTRALPASGILSVPLVNG